MSNNQTVRLFHVGGREGGIGPAVLLFALKGNLSLTVFEANIGEDSSWNAFEKEMDDFTNREGVKPLIIQQCLSNCVGKKEFHVNAAPACSSLLKMSPDAKNYTRMHGSNRIIWGEICQPTSTIEVDVTTLDELYANGMIQLPHFLSIDAQGAEYEILEGASKALEGDLVGVITEVEFRELYEGQKLFADQFTLLSKHQFSLFDLYSCEFWYFGYIGGKGALMVAEALFLRDLDYFIKKYKEAALLLPNLSKLAIVAYCFDRYSYAFQIIEYIMKNWRQEWMSYVEESGASYLYGLMEFYWQSKRRIEE